MKFLLLVLSVVSVASLGAAPANAHSPQAVRYKLQDHGYSRIRFTDRVLPIYQLNACRRGRRFHMHVNYYGEVVRRERIGYCPDARRYRRDHVDRRYRTFPRYRENAPRRYIDRPPRYQRYY